MRLKVIDLSRVLAGPLCGMILGDLGADVIKVERPGSGDETRGYGPPFDQRGESAYYLSVNRNKKSVALDLTDPDDRAILIAWMSDADVVIDNFVPGKLRELGFDVEDLLESHPRLVWCSISGFGPDSVRPGYDFVTQAESGWMSITGEPDGPPVKVGVALADVVAGKDAALAILGLIVERNNGLIEARRRRIQISLITSAIASLVNVAQSVLVSGGVPKRWGNAHPNLVPYQLFHTADAPIVVAIGSDSQWIACANALDLQSLADDEQLCSNAGRVRNRDRIVDAMESRLTSESAAHWVGKLNEAGVPCGMVRTVAEALENVDASALNGVESAVGGTVRMPPPTLDEHGAELRASGWNAFAR
jgi:crotonobetainyl-CoA:carnitine CoA-transferase CaiB-like acyl-CoA transferase